MSDSKKIKKLTVREIREIEPKSELFEIQPYHKIIVMLKKSIIPEANQLLPEKAKVIMQAFAKRGIEPVILIGVDDDVKFYEIGDVVKK
jgi:hypothetical protein